MAESSSTRALPGRGAELAAIAELLTQAADGRAGTLLITGAAGVGKTTLVRTGSEAAQPGFAVLWASCFPLSSLAVPFLPLTSALRRWTASGRAAAPQDASPNSLDDWLDQQCAVQPVLLVVDDVQWADQSTLDVLMYLVALPPRRRLAIMLTLRTGEFGPGHLLHRWLADIRRLPAIREMDLRLLNRPETAEQLTELLGRPPRQSLVDDVYQRTSGNPYLTALLARGLNPDADAGPADVPSDLRDAVLRAWHGLMPRARQLTRQVAVAGQPVDVALLQQLECNAPVLSTLREAVDHGVLLPVAGGRYWFVHPLLAEVLEGTLLPDERRILHASFAAALEDRLKGAAEPLIEEVIEVADHHYQAQHLKAAFDWALRGAKAASSAGGDAEGLRLLRRALDLLPGLPDERLSARHLLTRIHETAERAGAQEEALRAVNNLLDLLDPSREPLRVAELLTRRTTLGFWTGHAFAELNDVREAVRLTVNQPRCEQWVVAMAELAHAEMWHGLPSGPARAREAAAAARRLSTPKALAYALSADVMATCLAGGTDQRQARQAQDAALRAGDYWAYVQAVLWGIVSRGTLEDPAVLEFLEASHAELRAAGAAHSYVAVISNAMAWGYLGRGQWRVCLDLARSTMAANPGPLASVGVRLSAALIASRQGRPGEAAAHLRRAMELGADHSTFALFGLHAVQAELAMEQGNFDVAVQTALIGLRLPTPPDAVERLLPLAARALADEAWRTRDANDDPSPILNRLADLRRQYPHIVKEAIPGDVYRRIVAAMQALYDAESDRCRNDRRAGTSWLHAAAACESAELLWENAYAQWRAAEALLPGRSRRSEAIRTLRRAYELAVDLEMAPISTELEALARSVRVPLSAPATDDFEDERLTGLTARQREIVAHVVAGHTYAEIARTLYISEKTVSSHISTILSVTGTANRVELAKRVRRLSSQRAVPDD